MSSTSGSYSSSSVIGKESVACGLGYQNKAKASLDSWIVLTERKNDGTIINIKSAKIDGKKMKAETFYILKRGKFIYAK
jgi:hypothetical protein